MNRPKRPDKIAAGAGRADTASSGDGFGPEDIRLIENVLKTYCVEVGIVDRVEVSDIAAIIVTLWQMGHRTEAQLLEQLRAESALDPPASSGTAEKGH